MLKINLWKKLLNALARVSRGTEEFTIEANPESLSCSKIRLFRDYGVNRLSIGVQSFSDKNLKMLGRIHTAKRAINAVKLTERGGFLNIGIDLIFGVWNQTLDAWRNDLNIATSLPIKHISTYALSIEDKTALSGKISLDEDLAAGMYELSMEYLPKKGFKHYETSNFSKKGYACKHNIHYWDNGPSIGLGPSACSYCGGTRSQNLLNTNTYIKKVKSNQNPNVFSETLPKIKRAKELAVLKLRTKEGVNFKDFKKRTGIGLREVEHDTLSRLVSEGFLRYRRRNNNVVGVSLTKKGFLFSDTVSVELL